MLNLDKVCVEKAKQNGLDNGVEEFLKMFCEAPRLREKTLRRPKFLPRAGPRQIVLSKLDNIGDIHLTARFKDSRGICRGII